MYTYLGYTTSIDGTTVPTSYTKLCAIKSFPDLGGAPEKIEITTLEDAVQTFVNGVQALDPLEFTANYDPDDYDSLKKLRNGENYFCVGFRTNALGDESNNTLDKGAWAWKGQLSVWVVGGGVNAAREMRISISASTEIQSIGSTATMTISQS
jgi:hypothetical protein